VFGKATDQLEDNINPIATMLYGVSRFHCMTQSLANGSLGLARHMLPARSAPKRLSAPSDSGPSSSISRVL
jgi:hypothetical protein